MTTWAVESPMQQAPSMKLTTCVVEAKGGVFRTVMGSVNANEMHVVLSADNPLCALLTTDSKVRVMAADGRTFDARSSDAAAPGKELLALVQERLSALHRDQGTPRIFRLVLGTVLGEEHGQTPRT